MSVGGLILLRQIWNWSTGHLALESNNSLSKANLSDKKGGI